MSFCRTYNDLTYPQAEAVREKINSDPLPGKLTCLNSQGNKTICAYSSKTYNGWFLVGSIEVSALSQASGSVVAAACNDTGVCAADCGELGLFPAAE